MDISTVVLHVIPRQSRYACKKFEFALFTILNCRKEFDMWYNLIEYRVSMMLCSRYWKYRLKAHSDEKRI
ncbi:MAG: hypothetical protein HQM09_13610 [Candidatus Riflebacteria bacterium]|nr:hypothetical protein [Candidatus Riflebacteria bacterium]